MNKLSDFDLDLSRGIDGEKLAHELATTIEVKRDRRWQETGNVYIKYECFYQRSGQYELSGIAVTKSEYYGLVLEKDDEMPLVLYIKTDILKQAVKKYGRKIECYIEPNNSKGLLIKVEDLIKYAREN